MNPDLLAKAKSLDPRPANYLDPAMSAPLDFEIERWDSATGTLVAWVRLPSLDSGTDTVLYVVYGDGDALDRSNKAGTWSNGFQYVWHMSEDPSGSAPQIKDSKNAAHATSSGMNGSDSVDAVAGKGLDFDGTNDQLTFTNTFTGPGDHTISAWVNQAASASAADTLIAFGTTSNNQLRLVWTDDGNSILTSFISSASELNTSIDIEGAGWTYLTWTYDGSTSTVRTNDGTAGSGGATQGKSYSSANTQGTEGKIGNSTWQDYFFGGQLDEVRVATIARTSAWITTEYNNQRPGSDFIDIGSEVAR